MLQFRKAMGLPEHELQLWQRPWVDYEALEHYVELPETQIGGLRFKTLKAVENPLVKLPAGVEGVLGGDFFGRFNLEYNLKAGKLNLFSPDHCPGQVVYWANQYVAMPILHDRAGRPYSLAELDVICPL